MFRILQEVGLVIKSNHLRPIYLNHSPFMCDLEKQLAFPWKTKCHYSHLIVNGVGSTPRIRKSIWGLTCWTGMNDTRMTHSSLSLDHPHPPLIHYK